jgi:hypothetical protein
MPDLSVEPSDQEYISVIQGIVWLLADKICNYARSK